MGRWKPDARGRLGKAALELYAERGFDQTTVAEIARRAGLTERTFFRHYADKREVLFGGAAVLEERMAAAAAGAPASAGPLDAVAAALDAAGEMLQEGREIALLRQPVIVAHPELREREMAKLASLVEALARTLRGRGVPDPEAPLAAEAGVGVFKVAFERWILDPDSPALPEILRDCLSALRSVASDARTPAS
jgi:AcrR family transcriptional regulator